MINNLQLGVLSKILIDFIKMLDVAIMLQEELIEFTGVQWSPHGTPGFFISFLGIKSRDLGKELEVGNLSFWLLNPTGVSHTS